MHFISVACNMWFSHVCLYIHVCSCISTLTAFVITVIINYVRGHLQIILERIMSLWHYVLTPPPFQNVTVFYKKIHHILQENTHIKHSTQFIILSKKAHIYKTLHTIIVNELFSLAIWLSHDSRGICRVTNIKCNTPPPNVTMTLFFSEKAWRHPPKQRLHARVRVD